MGRSMLLVGTAACVLCLAGCGGKEQPLEDTTPFTAAIETYLKENSMGMRVDSYDSLRVEGDNATAEARMAAKDINYGVRQLWAFAFEKQDGVWRVTEVKR